MPSAPGVPESTDVLVVGCGPAGASAATWLARAGWDVTAIDAATFPRDKTCGDGLTPRAMSEMDRLGVGDWARDRVSIRGLELSGFGHTRQVPWPGSAYGAVGSAVPRTVLDDRLRRTAIEAGATVLEGTPVAAVEQSESGEVTAVRLDTPGSARIRCRHLVLADGVRSPIGRQLGRQWHRDTVYAVAARSYLDTALVDPQWIGSDLELRDANGATQAGYGWVFPLGEGQVNLGVGTLATAARPAKVAVKELLAHYAEVARTRWQLNGPPQQVTSALLPMGGAVSGIAGPNWAAVGDAAACVNPLNGEGIDYALEGGRLLSELLTAHPQSQLTQAWPALLHEHYGEAFTIARNLAWLLTVPRALELGGPIGMRSQHLMAAAVRCMSNVVSSSDRDLLARSWRTAGRLALRADQRPLFGQPAP